MEAIVDKQHVASIDRQRVAPAFPMELSQLREIAASKNDQRMRRLGKRRKVQIAERLDILIDQPSHSSSVLDKTQLQLMSLTSFRDEDPKN